MADKASAALEERRRDPRIRGIGLTWRLALVLAACAAMLVWRIDIGTSWLFFACGLLALYRLPRVVRLVRAGDALSAAPWLILGAGTALAVAQQAWAAGSARQQFESLVAALERDPCQARTLLPPVVREAGGERGTWHVIRAGLLDYPVLVRDDAQRSSITLTLHVDIDDVDSRIVQAPGCPKPPARA